MQKESIQKYSVFNKHTTVKPFTTRVFIKKVATAIVKKVSPYIGYKLQNNVMLKSLHIRDIKLIGTFLGRVINNREAHQHCNLTI
jgi:predicted nucleic acid binding AN1-type Zn finger protein